MYHTLTVQCGTTIVQVEGLQMVQRKHILPLLGRFRGLLFWLSFVMWFWPLILANPVTTSESPILRFFAIALFLTSLVGPILLLTLMRTGVCEAIRLRDGHGDRTGILSFVGEPAELFAVLNAEAKEKASFRSWAFPEFFWILNPPALIAFFCSPFVSSALQWMLLAFQLVCTTSPLWAALIFDRQVHINGSELSIHRRRRLLPREWLTRVSASQAERVQVTCFPAPRDFGDLGGRVEILIKGNTIPMRFRWWGYVKPEELLLAVLTWAGVRVHPTTSEATKLSAAQTSL